MLLLEEYRAREEANAKDEQHHKREYDDCASSPSRFFLFSWLLRRLKLIARCHFWCHKRLISRCLRRWYWCIWIVVRMFNISFFIQHDDGPFALYRSLEHIVIHSVSSICL